MIWERSINCFNTVVCPVPTHTLLILPKLRKEAQRALSALVFNCASITSRGAKRKDGDGGGSGREARESSNHLT